MRVTAKRLLLSFLIVLLPATASPVLAVNTGKPPTSQTARTRLALLKRGINACDWFIYKEESRILTEKRFQRTVRIETARIQSMGFDHVRLCIDPELPQREPKFLSNLNYALRAILLHKMSVVIDVHPAGNFYSVPETLISNSAYVERVKDLWKNLAREIGALNPERVSLEILNEPDVTHRELWYKLQSELVSTVRALAPKNTLVVLGADHSSLEDLLEMKPVADPNVIYDFHFYRPGIFTHQTTTWAVPYYGKLKGVPYPFGPEDDPMILAQIPVSDQEGRRLFHERYEGQRWDKKRIDALIQQAADWGAKWDVPIICEEFGVYRLGTRADYRTAWIRDVRVSLEKHGMGWAFWSYNPGGFGLMLDSGGKLAPDLLELRALGL